MKKDDVVIAKSLDRISPLPVAEGEALIARFTDTGATTAVPDRPVQNYRQLGRFPRTAHPRGKSEDDAKDCLTHRAQGL